MTRGVSASGSDDRPRSPRITCEHDVIQTEERKHMNAKNSTSQQGINSVEIAMRAVEAIERLGGSAPLSTVAGEASMSPSTAHRYLVSLCRTGLVTQDAATGWYNLGPAARRLGLEAMRRSDDVSLASGYAARLRAATGHTVNIAVWADSGPVIVRWEYGLFPLPIIARVGSTLPLADSSVGRVFLAYLPRTVTAPTLRAQEKHGESSAPSPEELDDMLAEVRHHGFSETRGGVLPGLVVVAAPVFAAGDVLTLTLATAVLTRLAKPSVVRSITEHTRAHADALSRELGGPTAAETRESEG